MEVLDKQKTVEQLLLVMPSWVGDIVMATPTLRALHELYPNAQKTALVKREMKALLEGCPWVDRTISIRSRRQHHPQKTSKSKTVITLARRLAGREFDLAVLFPNSFRTALLTRMAGIAKRVGYERDNRGFLLTDRLLPRRQDGHFVPVSTRDYYLGIARYLGAEQPSDAMALFTRPQDDQQALALLKTAGYQPSQGPLVLLNPGANYGDAKMWFPQNFAEVGDYCAKQFGATIAVSGSPKEKQIIEQVIAASKQPMINLPSMGVGLGLLKSVIKYSQLMVTNDTGPRHMAAALDTPVVTIFGPTDPAWSEINFHLERKVQVDVFCGPCQKKKCPLDHRCMTLISSQMVIEQADLLLSMQMQNRSAS